MLLRGDFRYWRKGPADTGRRRAVSGWLVAEERRRKPVGDDNQVALQEIDEFVQPGGEDVFDRMRGENRAQLVEPFRDVVAGMQPIVRLQLAERRLDLAHAQIDRARKGRVEQQ